MLVTAKRRPNTKARMSPGRGEAAASGDARGFPASWLPILLPDPFPSECSGSPQGLGRQNRPSGEWRQIVRRVKHSSPFQQLGERCLGGGGLTGDFWSLIQTTKPEVQVSYLTDHIDLGIKFILQKK
jgi:hypothetical protein